MRAGGKAPVRDLAQSRFLLAQALWDAPADRGRDRARAREQAELAARSYRDADADADVVEVETWLRDHPP